MTLDGQWVYWTLMITSASGEVMPSPEEVYRYEKDCWAVAEKYETDGIKECLPFIVTEGQ